RHFAQDVLLRHEPICRKLFNKKRRPFNSLKQRLQGTNIPTVKKKTPKVLKSNWRQQHEAFINAIQSAKLAAKAMREGRPLPPPPPPSINPDYIQCPYCSRRFNEAAAGRHITFCKEQAARQALAADGLLSQQGKQQTHQKKEPTITSAVGILLQNRTQEVANANSLGTGKESSQQNMLIVTLQTGICLIFCCCCNNSSVTLFLLLFTSLQPVSGLT
uniref:Zinc finger C2HC-type containing 1B n=1 Tax=Sphenodon punctatus TaxID=8508 RepID=A0A8D0GKQ4_SPHPU